MDDHLYVFQATPVFDFDTNGTIKQIIDAPYSYFQGADLAWMMTSSVLVFLMVPGVALFYAGVATKRHSLSMAWLPIMTTAVVGVQWYLWGHAIVFSNWPTSTTFWGGTDGIALINVLVRPVPAKQDLENQGQVLPELLYSLFQGMFACFTASLVSGTAMGKDRPGHFLIFIIFWSTFVYDPIARWSWNLDGWLNKKGSLDFAGGTCVHICAGASVLAHSIFHRHLHKFESFMNNSSVFRGPKRLSEPNPATPPLDTGSVGPVRPNTRSNNEPAESAHSMEYVILGTTLLWAGWFGFNGGSALGANMRAVSACVSTHLAACSGGVTLCVLRTVSEYIWTSKAPGRRASSTSSQDDDRFVFSIIEFCNGAIIGLVCITPAAGYVPHYVAPVFGLVGSLWCSWFTPLGEKIGDTHGIVVVHAFAGFMGMFLTGIFASKKVAHLDGFTEISGGAWDGNRIQIGWQLVDATCGALYAFLMTGLILIVLEPFAFLARRRQARSSRAPGTGVSDEGVIREAIEMNSYGQGQVLPTAMAHSTPP